MNLEGALRLAVDEGPFGLAIIDREMRVLHINKAFARLSIEAGFKGDPLSEANALELLPASLRERLSKSMSSVLQTGESLSNIDLTVPLASKQSSRLLLSLFPVATEEIDHHFVCIFFLDISSQKELLSEVAWNPKRLKNITDVIPMLVTYIDKTFHYRFNNKTSEEWFGQSYRDILGQPVEDILGREGFAICKPYMERTFSGESVMFERALWHPEKGERQVQIYYAPDINPRGGVDGMIAAVWDVTEERELQKSIALQHRRLKEILSQVPAVIWEVQGDPESPKAQVSFVSDYVEKLLGYPPQAMEGTATHWMFRVHPDDRGRLGEAMKELYRKLLPAAIEFRWITKSGSVIEALTYMAVVTDEHGAPTGIRGVTLDITDRKRMETELRSATEKLKKAVRIRDDFISIAAHELRTPITSLKLEYELLLRAARKTGGLSSLPAAHTEKLLSTGSQQLQFISSLVDDLLDTSRISEGRLQLALAETDLVPVVAGVVERFSTRLSTGGQQLLFDHPPSLLGVWDRFRIEQLVVNLISNAVKYGAGRPIRVRAYQKEENAVIEVQDEGIGIAPEMQSKIFERFERAISHKNISGLGLGLYIVNQVVKAHHGTIRVDSTLGKGSTFTVTLPLRASQSTDLNG